MRAEIITTGTELLTGGTIDTNSAFLSGELMLAGVATAFKTTVGDDERDLEAALRIAVGRADVVIVTGGIGPTEDDITRKVVAKVTKNRLILNEDALKDIEARLAGRGRDVIAMNDRQALIPSGARLLRNPIGIAPGFLIEEEGLFLAVLPGVPREMDAMFTQELRPMLRERFSGKTAIVRRILHTCGISESKVNQAIQEHLKRKTPVVGLTAQEAGVNITILSRANSARAARAEIEAAEAGIRSRLGDHIFGVDGQTMEEIVGTLLLQRNLRIAVAESCTGGMIGGRITNVAGSSAYFDRGVTVYSNTAKVELLGVSPELIEKYGAVSAEVASAMAQGIMKIAQVDLGLSVTGIAGPDGGTEAKPVGLVFTALATAHGVKTTEHRFLGTREQVRERSAQSALDMVRKHLIA